MQRYQYERNKLMDLCVLGFDALDSKIFEKSDLYWFKYIRDNGQWGTLYSESMRTAPSWTSILTGLSIKQHGITHLLGYPYDGSGWFNGRPKDYLFDALCEYGYHVGVANFPSILFARGISGGWSNSSWMIGGWPNRPNVYRNAYGNIDIQDDIYSDLPDYEERVLFEKRPSGAMKDWSIHHMLWKEYINFAESNAYKRMKWIELNLPKVDVFMFQESVLDRAGHMLSTPSKGRLGTEDERYQDALKLVNSIIGYVIEKYNPKYLSIVSDHGFQGLSEADPEKGCWHSHDGTWAVVGPDIANARNDTDQINYSPTILDIFGFEFDVKRSGYSILMKDDDTVNNRLTGLGYI